MEIFIAAAFGASLASFLGVIYERLPEEEPIFWGRSRCGHCKTALRTRDLIPIFSWLSLRGRCRYCGVHLSPLYPISEGLLAWLAVLLYLGQLSPPSFLMLVFSGLLSAFDLRSHDFPLVLVPTFLPFFLFFSGFQALHGLWLSLAILAFFVNLKIGAGDFIWLFFASFSLALGQILWLIQIASLLGIFYYFLKRKKGEIPFIPFLSIAYLAILIGEKILSM